jgi:putative two-component system response regulator
LTKVLPEEFRKASVVVVDDNPANVALLSKILKSEGYENVAVFTDPRLVRPHYEKNRVDIILLDIRMPYMDGFEVMAELNAVALDDYLPVLVLTAQTDIETRHRALESGAKDFLNKPFEQAEALNRIYNILDVRLMHNNIRDQNFELEKMVQARTREIEETRLDVIRRLGRAAEYRDNETGFHVIRMSKYCERLALATGLSEEDATILLNASPMHDVGKIGIPDSILLKPGKLDAEEWEIMKSHSTIGGEILSGSDTRLMEVARIVALAHHENWDGSGYPAGLSGEDIPLPGRIASICDVFDALLSDRPYKKAWPYETAIEFMRKESGTKYDPELLELFFAISDEILEIRDQWSDQEE